MNMEDILAWQQNKNKLILTATTGRSGTGLLCKIFKDLNIKSYHEKDKIFIFKTHKQRINYLINFISHNIKYNTVVETSHLFTKSNWFELLIKELNIIPKIIIIKRNNRDVAKSLYSLGTIPLKTEPGNNYLVDEESKHIYEKARHFSDYQLCFLYTLIIDKKIDFLKSNIFPKHSFIELSFNDILDEQIFINLLKKLDINLCNEKVKETLFKYKNKKINNKINEKRILPITNISKQENEIIKYFNELYT